MKTLSRTDHNSLHIVIYDLDNIVSKSKYNKGLVALYSILKSNSLNSNSAKIKSIELKSRKDEDDGVKEWYTKTVPASILQKYKTLKDFLTVYDYNDFGMWDLEIEYNDTTIKIKGYRNSTKVGVTYPKKHADQIYLDFLLEDVETISRDLYEEEKDIPNQYIKISEDRLRHILGVARKAYEIAIERGHDEDYAMKCFLMGWLHDVGYEFVEQKKYHSKMSGKMLLSLIDNESFNNDFIQAIVEHGFTPQRLSEEWIILNQADMQVGPNGQEMTIKERLEDIEKRFGKDSEIYTEACDVAKLCS